MAVESKRGCGYRKIGGLYLVCDAGGFACDRLPFALTVCPTCGAGIKFSRAWTWIHKPANLFKGIHQPCYCIPDCPVCDPQLMGEKAGLLWVGEYHYTVREFSKEANTMGISKRIVAVPRGLVLGETWVLLAHRKAALHPSETNLFKTELGPGIFRAFIPQRVEKIIPEGTSEEEKDKLTKRGITPVEVPANDPDHL